MSVLYILLLHISLLSGIEVENDPPALSLDQAISIALEENYGIQIRRNDVELAANNRTLGNAGFLPVVDATGSMQERVEDSRFRLSNDPDINENLGARSTMSSAGISLNWTLFDGTGMFIRYEQLGELESLGETVMRLHVEETVEQIVRSYTELVQLKNQQDLLEESLEITYERIEIAESQVELGTGSEYDLLEARTDLNADRSFLMRERVRYQEAQVRLNELMGREQDLEFRVADTISVNRSLDFEELKTRSTEQNTELAIARLERRIADLNRRELRSQRLPEIELFSGYDYNRTDGGGGFMQFNETQGFHIGLTARINLFDGFDMTRRIQNAEIEQRNRQLQFMEASDRLDAELLAAWLRYQNSLELVDLEEENLIHADERMEIALERFREGVISALEFRESQRVFLDARERLLQALYDAKVAESSLLRLSGDLGDLAI